MNINKNQINNPSYKERILKIANKVKKIELNTLLEKAGYITKTQVEKTICRRYLSYLQTKGFFSYKIISKNTTEFVIFN